MGGPGVVPRLAGHTYAFRDVCLAAALDALAELDFDAVEVWLGHVPTGAESDAAQLLADRRLDVVAVGAGGFYDDPAAADRAFEVARVLGATRVVACVSPSLLDAVAVRIPSGITLCVENHWDQPLALPGEIRRALRGRARLAACLDTGHALAAGVRPERFAAAVQHRLGHVHLKEGRLPGPVDRALGRRLRKRLRGRLEPVFPGEGALDVTQLRTALAEAGYIGAVSLEHEGAGATSALRALRAAWASA